MSKDAKIGGLVAVGLIATAALLFTVRDTDTVPNETRSTLNSVWVDMTTSERLDFCSQARDAGYTVVATEISTGTSYDLREVGYWLEDRCG